jgi:hypothetical protein
MTDQDNLAALGEALRRRKMNVVLESAESALPRLTGLDLTSLATDEEEAR